VNLNERLAFFAELKLTSYAIDRRRNFNNFLIRLFECAACSEMPINTQNLGIAYVNGLAKKL